MAKLGVDQKVVTTRGEDPRAQHGPKVETKVKPRSEKRAWTREKIVMVSKEKDDLKNEKRKRNPQSAPKALRLRNQGVIVTKRY